MDACAATGPTAKEEEEGLKGVWWVYMYVGGVARSGAVIRYPLTQLIGELRLW